LRVPDNLLGKKVKCPKCNNAFLAVAEQPAAKPRKPAPPPPQEEEEEAPRPRKPARREEEYEEETVARKRRPAPPPPEEEEEEAPRARRRRRDEDEEEEEAPRRRRRRDEEDEGEDEDYEVGSVRKQVHGTVADWKRVRTGITLLIYSIFIWLGDIVLAICGGCLVGFLAASAMQQGMQPGGRPDAFANAAVGGGMMILVVYGIVGVIALAGLGLNVTGNVFCLFAPPKNGAKMLAIVALALFGLALLGSLVNLFLPAATAMGGGSPMAFMSGPVGLGTSFASVASWVVFLFFLRSLSLAMNDRGLAQSVVYLVVMAGITIVLHVIFVLVTILAAASLVASAAGGGNIRQMEGSAAGAGMLVLVFGVVVGCLYLACFIWYIITLFQVRGAITRHVGSRR
jgi:hypothetical protein